MTGGAEHGADQIGSATIATDSTREFKRPDSSPPDQAACFYAVAYDLQTENGTEKVISYRGTVTMKAH